MAYDVAALRRHFPALAEGAAHFDGPGGSQVPDVVGAAVGSTLVAAISNRGRGTPAERRADDIVTGARRAMAEFLGADPRGIVFGRSMTQLTYDFARTLAKDWSAGDVVVVSRLDHDANVRPWLQVARAVGAEVAWIGFEPNRGELTPADVTAALRPRTRLVALTAGSNLLGTRPDLATIAPLVKAAGALLYVDGVHLSPHAPIDVSALGADFYVCSPYKFLGPHCGVLAADPTLLETLHPDKLLASSDELPERFELGTLPYELLAGTTAAVDFLAAVDPGTAAGRRERVLASMAAIETHEERCCAQVEAALDAVPGVRLHSRPSVRTPTLLFSVAGLAPTELSAALARGGVNAPAGHFYALEASRWIGLGDRGALRVGMAPYTDASDVDRLVDGVERIADDHPPRARGDTTRPPLD